MAKFEIEWTLGGRLVVEPEDECTSEQLWESVFGELEVRAGNINEDIMFGLGAIELSTDEGDPQITIREVGADK